MGHLGISGLKRQIRNHFAFPQVNKIVEDELRTCHDCQIFTTKATKDPLIPVYVPPRSMGFC